MAKETFNKRNTSFMIAPFLKEQFLFAQKEERYGIIMNTRKKLLIIDDDPKMLAEIQAHLGHVNYEVKTALDGVSGLNLARKFLPDLIILDITFPVTTFSSIDGVEILRELRVTSNIPVLMLSSTNITSVKVMALNMGADDYISKPFEMQELRARIEAVLRRFSQESSQDKVLNFNRLRLDPDERHVWKDNKLIQLTGIEFDILHLLARRPNHVFSRDSIIEQVWQDDTVCVAKAVDVHIGHIRKKIEDSPINPTFIATVRGTGYRFEDVSS